MTTSSIRVAHMHQQPLSQSSITLVIHVVAQPSGLSRQRLAEPGLPERPVQESSRNRVNPDRPQLHSASKS